MKTIRESKNDAHFPRHRVKSIECRKRDLIIRITDWTKDKDEPAFDVECYIGGVYDFNESKSFTLREYKENAAGEAVTFAQKQVAKLI
jgi:hypothetical protein